MQYQTASYQVIRSAMRPGDIIAFSGRTKFSRLIKLATNSNVTHVAIVCLSQVEYHGSVTVEIMESVKEEICHKTGQAITGVTRNRMSTRLAHYHGKIWWLPLSQQTRAKLNFSAAINFLMSVHGRPYDMPQAIQSALNTLDRFKIITYAAEDYSALFCSELAAGALKHGGILDAGFNPSETTPVDLVRLPVYDKYYYQLKGDTASIIM